MSQITDSINNLSPNERRDLLSQLLQDGSSKVKVYPLSYAQERLWFLDQFQPGNAAYNVPLTVELSFAVKVSVLERSLNELVRVHEVLRSTFRFHQTNPL